MNHATRTGAGVRRSPSNAHQPAAMATPSTRKSLLPAFAIACIGPIAVSVAVLGLAPYLAESDAGARALRNGGLLAAAAALLVCLAIGVWMTRACGRGGSAFLGPLAGGFLVKLAVLGLGTVLLAGPLSGLGNHIAFALAFAAAAFAFQTLFTPALSRALRAAAT